MSEKSPVGTVILCVVLGFLGLHRFYVGKWKTGLLFLLTCGCFGIGQTYDMVTILLGKFNDSDGYRIPSGPAVIGATVVIYAIFFRIAMSAENRRTNATVNSVSSVIVRNIDALLPHVLGPTLKESVKRTVQEITQETSQTSAIFFNRIHVNVGLLMLLNESLKDNVLTDEEYKEWMDLVGLRKSCSRRRIDAAIQTRKSAPPDPAPTPPVVNTTSELAPQPASP